MQVCNQGLGFSISSILTSLRLTPVPQTLIKTRILETLFKSICSFSWIGFSKDGRPVQLRDLAAALRKGEDHAGLLAAVHSAETLIRAAPAELATYGAELARSLLHSRIPEWADSEEEKEDRKPSRLRLGWVFLSRGSVFLFSCSCPALVLFSSFPVFLLPVFRCQN